MLAIQTDVDDGTDAAKLRERLGAWDLQPLAETIRRDGVACVPAYFTGAEIAEASGQIDAVRSRDAAPAGAAAGCQAGILSRHFASPAMRGMCSTLCAYLDRRYRGADDCREMLRYLSSESPGKHFYYFHFDSYRLTIIAPVRMPESEQRGDLLIFPNLRRVPRSYWRNILDKAVQDSRWMQALRKRQALRGGLAKRIPLVPGNIYLIDGSRTLHANASIDPGELRVTLVYHFAETHRDHWVRTLRRRMTSRH